MGVARTDLIPQMSEFAKRASRTVGARFLDGEICQQRRKGGSGCGGETKFEIPVIGDDGETDGFNHSGPATICVIDDMAYMYPRYGGNRWAVQTPYDQEQSDE